MPGKSPFPISSEVHWVFPFPIPTPSHFPTNTLAPKTARPMDRISLRSFFGIWPFTIRRASSH